MLNIINYSILPRYEWYQQWIHDSYFSYLNENVLRTNFYGHIFVVNENNKQFYRVIRIVLAI